MNGKYSERLKDYLRWSSRGGIFRSAEFPFSAHGPTAEKAMRDWETHGIVPKTCSNPHLLADYIHGKKLRDWHISEWKTGVRQGLFIPEEFIEYFSEKEFKSVFGVSPRKYIAELLNVEGNI